MLDIEIDDVWRWCEYIAFRGLWRIGFARLHESDISDTELQVSWLPLMQLTSRSASSFFLDPVRRCITSRIRRCIGTSGRMT